METRTCPTLAFSTSSLGGLVRPSDFRSIGSCHSKYTDSSPVRAGPVFGSFNVGWSTQYSKGILSADNLSIYSRWAPVYSRWFCICYSFSSISFLCSSLSFDLSLSASSRNWFSYFSNSVFSSSRSLQFFYACNSSFAFPVRMDFFLKVSCIWVTKWFSLRSFLITSFLVSRLY